MKSKSYFWEIKDLVTQFIAAFDDVIISRYDNNRVEKEKIEVRYVFGPKQRVMYDIVNKAQNLTLPVVAVNITSVTRDNSRVFSKIESSYLTSKNNKYGPASAEVPSPVPINIEISMSILGRYMSDIDQIISNFIPYTNPYIILSWKLPDEFNLENITEIRSEVLWNGNLAYSAPTDLTYSDKFRIVVDTSFTIKGWIFKPAKEVKTIYKVTSNFFNTELQSRVYYNSDDYVTLSGYNAFRDVTDTVIVSAVPAITNLFYSSSAGLISIVDNYSIRRDKNNEFLIYGKRFGYSNTFYISSNVIGFYSNSTPVSTAKSPLITVYKLNAKQFTILNDNIAVINLSANTLPNNGQFTFITANSAGWSQISPSYTLSAK